MPLTASDISIVVPIHQGGAEFAQCAASLQALEPRPAQVIAVFDGHDPQSEAAAAAAGMEVIKLAARQGASAARNAGASHAQTDWILFIDADVLVPVSIVADVVSLLTDHPDATAIFGSYDDSPAHPAFLSQYRNLLHHYTHQMSRPEASTFWGACGVIKREVFEAVGGYDRHVRGIEDIELGYRLRAAGHTILLEKSLQVKHLKQWTFGKMLYTDIFMRGVPWAALMWGCDDAVYDLNIDRRGRISVVLAWLFLLGLAAMILSPWFALMAIVCALGLLYLNRHFYLYLQSLRGWRFALTASLFHGLYFFYSGAAYVIGTWRYWRAEFRR